ncbi:hypothetical protein Pmar_PMAR005599, partial [Perkinsus marinus ATCC 50983]
HQCYCMTPSSRPTSSPSQLQRHSVSSSSGRSADNPASSPPGFPGEADGPSLIFPPYLALGIGRPVSLSNLAMYFESFGEADFLDCTRMLTESTDSYAIRLSFFDRRVTERVFQRFQSASTDDPRCGAISCTGASVITSAEPSSGVPMEIIAIISCKLVRSRLPTLGGEAADPRVVNVEQLCWSLPEAVDCCSEFGALASANGTSISASVMQGTELCREVEFYDSRAAEAFRNAIMVLERSREGRSSVNTSLGEITAPGSPSAAQPPPTVPHEPLITPRTEPGGAGLLAAAPLPLQPQVTTPQPTPWGGRSATTSPAPRYLTSQVARSLARFYRAVGVSDYKVSGALPSSSSSSSSSAAAAAASPMQSLVAPSPQTTAAYTTALIPGVEESLQIPEIESGFVNRTTVMVRNIPPAYTSSRLLQEILETMLELAGEEELATVNAAVGAPFGIDFVYLPFNLKNRAGVSYGFVNLTTPEALLTFYDRFDQHEWRSGTSRTHNGGERKPCEMSAARLQGQHAL